MKPILAFDVNETLLDLAALDPLFEQIFTDSSVRKEWFNQFIQNAFVTVIVDTYQPFGKIGMTALEMIAERRGVVLTEDHKAMIKDGLVNLPPYPEVHEAPLDRHIYHESACCYNSTMLPTADCNTQNKSLDEFLDQLKDSEFVDGVLLSGSTATGEMNKFSDIDLTLVVTEVPNNTLGVTTFVDSRFTEIYLYTRDEVRALLQKTDIDPDKKEGWIFNWIRNGKIILDKSGLLSEVKQKSDQLDLDKVSDYLTMSSTGKVNYNYTQNKRYFDSGKELHLKALEVRLLYCVAEVIVAYFNIRKLPWRGEKLAIKWLQQNDQQFLDLFDSYLKSTELDGKMKLYQKLADLALQPVGGLSSSCKVNIMADGDFTEDSLNQSLSYWSRLLGE